MSGEDSGKLIFPGYNNRGDRREINQLMAGNAAAVFSGFSAEDGEFRTAYCPNGGAAIVPDTDLSGVVATNIIKWENFISASAKGLTMFCQTANDDTSGDNNHLGWWLTVNAGSPVIAKSRLREALDTDTTGGQEISKYLDGGSATRHADENKTSFIIPPNSPIQINSVVPIVDVYVLPIAAVSVATGNSLLTAVLS